MKSMTGFAALDGTGAQLGWRWEIRSVNARGLDLKLRLPAGFEALDAALRALARGAVARGSVSASLSVFHERETVRARPEPEAIRAALDVLREVRETATDVGLPLAPVTGETLVPLLLGGAGESRAPRPDVDILKKPLCDGFEAAIGLLVTARQEEGARTARIIAGHLTQIESLVWDAEERADDAVHALRDRVRRQISDLMGDDTALDSGRLEQEVAILATRADVREEIDRLKAHIAAAKELLAAEGPVGRKLDFLTQEFNREANTLCSKSATDALTRIGLDLKTVIDQLREQAANVE